MYEEEKFAETSLQVQKEIERANAIITKLSRWELEKLKIEPKSTTTTGTTETPSTTDTTATPSTTDTDTIDVDLNLRKRQALDKLITAINKIKAAIEGDTDKKGLLSVFEQYGNAREPNSRFTLEERRLELSELKKEYESAVYEAALEDLKSIVRNSPQSDDINTKAMAVNRARNRVSTAEENLKSAQNSTTTNPQSTIDAWGRLFAAKENLTDAQDALFDARNDKAKFEKNKDDAEKNRDDAAKAKRIAELDFEIAKPRKESAEAEANAAVPGKSDAEIERLNVVAAEKEIASRKFTFDKFEFVANSVGDLYRNMKRKLEDAQIIHENAASIPNPTPDQIKAAAKAKANLAETETEAGIVKNKYESALIEANIKVKQHEVAKARKRLADAQQNGNKNEIEKQEKDYQSALADSLNFEIRQWKQVPLTQSIQNRIQRLQDMLADMGQ
jgi:hypothetical protein